MGNAEQADDRGVERDETGHPSGEIQVRPTHAFGLRTATLAGLVMTAASAAAIYSPLVTLAPAAGAPCCVSGP